MTHMTEGNGFPWPWRAWKQWKTELEVATVRLRAELDQVQETNERNRRALSVVRETHERERVKHA